MNLKRKVGPLPLWGWIAVAGGGLGMVYLIKKSKEKAPAGTEPIPSSFGANPPIPEASSAGGGTSAGGEVKTTPAESPTPVAPVAPTSPTYERGGFAGEVNDVAEGAAALEALGVVVPAGRATSSQAGAAAMSRVASTGGNPRAGLPFKATTYKGQAAHEYAHAVPGGVGPGKRFIVLPIGRKNHSAKGDHSPAHAKAPAPHHAKPKPPARRKPKPAAKARKVKLPRRPAPKRARARR